MQTPEPTSSPAASVTPPSPGRGERITGNAHKKTQPERSQEARERITAAAITVLRRKGFAGFRVADVATEAGVSRGAQTHHFPSKRALVLAVFATVFNQASEASRARIAGIQPNDDVIDAILVDAAEFFLSPDFPMGLDMLGAAERDPELRDAVSESARATRSLVEQMWVDLLIARGLPRPDAEDLLWLIFSAIRGLSVRMLWQFDNDRFERLKRITYHAACDLYEKKQSGIHLKIAEQAPKRGILQ